ncbi:3'-5' exonuclease [Myxococcus sp. MISCRS1]|uniref:3'-5' exonuclease n=1 Tax=Myxococcus sp. MISCRS1 TaxID=2996786 RepID=UPI00227188A6|nr:3'-5' exonuclease [Myxococcus sp. MISCRS1]MCY1003939.1 3'-5' exonuclease [Myxococcus sp. MISCRS1]
MVDLFHRAEAAPRDPATPAQLSALEKANSVRAERNAERARKRSDAAAARQEVLRKQVAAAMNSLRTSALAALKSWTADARTVVVDVESTDLNGRVIEVAVVDLAGTVLLQRRINPGCEIHPGAQAIHGLTQADLAGQPAWDGVVDEFEAVTRGRNVLAFNATFDGLTIARSTEVSCGSEKGRLARKAAEDWHCVMGAMAPLMGEWDSKYNDFKLPSLARAVVFANADVTGLPPAHSAVGDALRTVALVHAAALLPAKEFAVNEIPDLWLAYRPRAVSS